MRYLRAFFTTIQMMVRGEQPRNANLQLWVDQTVKLVDQIIKTAEQEGLSQDKRKNVALRLDGRSINMETILTTVRYHATDEYPHLLLHDSKHIQTAIYATNLDDRYRVASLQDAVELRSVKDAITRLSAHLDAIPPSSTQA